MIDSHCHINDPKFNGEVDNIVNNFLSAGVEKAICIGCCIESSKDCIDLANKYDCVYCTVGVHPSDCEKYDEQKLEEMIINNKKIVAIGEIGLTGEIRSVSNMNKRLTEVARLGFKKCIIPHNGAEKLEIPPELTVYKVKNIREAIEAAL